MPDNSGNVVPFRPSADRSGLSPALAEQFQVFGEEFNTSEFRRVVAGTEICRPARRIVLSFNPDSDTAIRGVYSSAIFDSVCVPNDEGCGEVANYSLRLGEGEEEKDAVTIRISPKSLAVMHAPIDTILQKSDMPQVNKVQIAHKAIYAGVLAQYAMKRFIRSSADGMPVRNSYDRIDLVYEEIFPDHRIADYAVRLNRVAMAVGGAVMLRGAASDIGNRSSESISPPEAGTFLRFYALGLAKGSEADTDQCQVSFALAHALTPQQTARVLRFWFTGSEYRT